MSCWMTATVARSTRITGRGIPIAERCITASALVRREHERRRRVALMSEAPETPPAPTETPAESAPEQRTVPYDRFQQVNQEARQAKQQLEELNTRLQELEDRDKSEVERERTQRERAQTEAQELKARLQNLERGSLVRSAAAEAGFIDPDDAVGFVSLSEIESEKDAVQAVRNLAKRKQHLIKQAQPPAQIGQVLANGQPTQAGGPSQRDIEAEQFLEQVKTAQESGWFSSPVE